MLLLNSPVNNSIENITSSLSQSSKLLLDTTAVTTSDKIFTLEDDYTNYKELYFEVEMNFSWSSNVALFTNIIIVDTIRTDYRYIIFRTTGAGSYEGSVDLYFVSDNNTDVIINKTSSTFNGCRRLRIFGIK